MCINFLLNLNPSKPEEAGYSGYPGHPHFSNGSKPMSTLLAATANPPVANAWALWWEQRYPSPEYQPLSPSPLTGTLVGTAPVAAPSSASVVSTRPGLTPDSLPRSRPLHSLDGRCLHSGPPCSEPMLSPSSQIAQSSQLLISPLWPDEVSYTSKETELINTRYEDGEVLRYGAGESYRPFNNGNRDRSPRRVRSPPRDRERERDQRPRTPPVASDSYVPGRSPRRRSRSADRYRGPDRARDNGGESWRRRDSSRVRVRSPVRRPSPPARRSPRRSPPRYSPAPRRDDRFDRARSPRRDFDNRDIR